MKLKHKQRIHEVCAKDGLYSYVRVLRPHDDRPQLVATDGLGIAAVVPCDAEPDDGFLGGEMLHRDGFAEVHKGKAGEERSVRLDTLGQGEDVPDYACFARGNVRSHSPLGEDTAFPDINAIVPEPYAQDLHVTLDVAQLVKLAKAMGADALTLRLQPGNDRQVRGAIRVEGQVKDGPARYLETDAYGVVQPITLEKEL